MRPSIEIHDALARLVEYPREGYAGFVEEAAAVLSEGCPQAWQPLQPFIEFARGQTLGELEERFTRTFDNTAERALEVGWHVFGENYTRGTFMVRMRQRLRALGVEENGELPDHLSHMLALLGRADEEWCGRTAHDSVALAMERVHEELVKIESPWSGVIDAVLKVLALHDRPVDEGPPFVPQPLPPLPDAQAECWSDGPGVEGPC